jgi:hypothetical protein
MPGAPLSVPPAASAAYRKRPLLRGPWKAPRARGRGTRCPDVVRRSPAPDRPRARFHWGTRPRSARRAARAPVLERCRGGEVRHGNRNVVDLHDISFSRVTRPLSVVACDARPFCARVGKRYARFSRASGSQPRRRPRARSGRRCQPPPAPAHCSLRDGAVTSHALAALPRSAYSNTRDHPHADQTRPAIVAARASRTRRRQPRDARRLACESPGVVGRERARESGPSVSRAR